MQVPKRSDPHLRIAHSIEEALIIRDFTEQERTCCGLILRLSWGCNKEWCRIPHLSDFEVVGIYRQDTRDLLAQLRLDNIIFWDENTNHFAFNKMFDQWRRRSKLIAFKKRDRFQELVKLNTSSSCPVPTDAFITPITGHLEPTPHTEFVSDSLTTDEPPDVSKSLTPMLEKNEHEVSKSLTPSDSASASPLINERKEEKKDPTPPAPPTPPAGGGVWEAKGKNYGEFCKVYEANIGALGNLIIAQELDELSQTYSLQWFQEAVKEAVLNQRRRLKYVAAILDRWGVDGYKAPMGKTFKGLPGRPPKGQLPTGDELERAWKGRKEV